jgi:hypothetical protein
MKLVRRLCMLGAMLGVLAGGYVAAPFATAWTIREAIKAGDSAYLEDKIEWTSVRATLKESLGKFAFSATGDMSEAAATPTVWQRIKAYVGQGALDKFVETTVTPTGMAGLLNMRKAYQTKISGEDAAARPPVWVRMRKVWSRVTRAEFASMDRFEMDMIDKAAPERTIACVLERRGLWWKMTELRVKSTDPSKRAAMQAQAAL